MRATSTTAEGPSMPNNNTMSDSHTNAASSAASISDSDSTAAMHCHCVRVDIGGEQEDHHQSSSSRCSYCVRILCSPVALLALLAVASQLLVSTCQASVLDENFGYQATTDVSDYLQLARDVQAMRIAKDDFDRKMDIYKNGQYGAGAAAAIPAQTLQGLSLKSGTASWSWNPLYNIYVQGFANLGIDMENDTPGNFDGEPVTNYADTLVRDLFLLNVTFIEADASVALNVGMAYIGALYDMLDACNDGVIASTAPPSGMDVATAMQASKDAMNAAIDRAMALYIGDLQEKGDDDSGYLLYNLAQFIGNKFNQGVGGAGSGEVRINQETIGKLFVLQEHANDGVTCTTPEGYTVMAERVRQLVRYLNTVYVQMLLFRTISVQAGVDSDFVELYALAITPQVASGCDSDLYGDFVDLLVALNVRAKSEDPESIQMALDVIQAALSCLGVTCEEVGALEGNRIPQCVNEEVTAPELAGFETHTDVNPIAYMDRDMTQIRWLMERQAYQAAAEFYQLGWNSLVSMQDLATRGGSPDFALFDDFYQSNPTAGTGVAPDTNLFAHNMIQAAVTGSSPFDQATPEQRTGVVDGLLKGVVMLLSITHVLEESLSTCAAAKLDPNTPPTTWTETVHRWESAVAYYVGSKEGPLLGGLTDGISVGESMYGLATQYCAFFNTCDAQTGDAINNQAIFDAFEFGRNQIEQKLCDSAQTIYNDDIRPMLMVPIIQGTLHHVSAAYRQPGGMDATFAFALSRAIVPFITAVSPTDAAKINSYTNYSPTPIHDAVMVTNTFNAFRDVIPKLGLKCDDIGTYRDPTVQTEIHPLCVTDPSNPQPFPPPPPVNPPPANPNPPPETLPSKEPPKPKNSNQVTPHPQGLAWGRYTFKNRDQADSDAKFALDIEKMWLASSTAEATAIYNAGQNVLTGLSNEPSIKTLASMSTNASDIMQNDILYNFYRYALYSDTQFDGFEESGWPYADQVVTMALKPDRGNSVRLGTESAVIMNIFMMIMHRLYEATRECQIGSNSAGLYIDSAVALWIGTAQAEGKYDSGYLMYWVAQEANRLYGVPEGEHPANTELMELFRLLQQLSEQCPASPDASYRSMRIKVDEVIRAMSIPLIQHLIYYVAVGDKNYEELYALSVIPQMSACNIGDYEFLRDTLFEGFVGNGTDQQALLQSMASGLSCLRIECADLGDTTNANDAVQDLVFDLCDELDDEYDYTFLAGYVTSNDVYEMARIDIDVHRIDMLMRAGAFDAARDIYMYGQNSFLNNGKDQLRSLKSLAMGDGIDDDDALLSLYTEYWGSATYPDDLIQVAMEGQDSYQSATKEQRAEAVKRTVQIMVTYMHITSRAFRAVEKCYNDEDGTLDIDEAAALFTGSLEGTESGGSFDDSGVMMMALAKETCSLFGKCESNNDATSNEFLMFAFSDIKEWLESSGCDSARSIVEDSFLKMFPVPVIQGVLMYAELNQNVPPENEGMATADVLARTILPEILDVNETSANTIISNMQFNRLAAQVPDGPEAVFDAFKYVMQPLNLDCATIGTFSDTGLSLCDEFLAAPDPDTPTDLGNNLYTTTTYVKGQAGIALDVKKMADDLTFSNGNVAKLIYKEGENSPIYNTLGQRIGERSLSLFSTNASEAMTTNPLYQLTVHALQDEDGKYLGAPATRYADSLVLESFTKGGKSPLAADAAVALNLWMEVANVVSQAFTSCKHRQVEDNDGIHFIDQVVAYWIGDEEVPLDAEQGHLLYNLAEVMGQTFGTIDPSGQAYTNSNFLKACTQARLHLSYPDACSEDMSTLRRLRHISERITTQMIIVQIQALINSLLEEDRLRVRVYAHGFVPLVSGCNPNAFNFLKDKLLDPTYIETEVEEIIEVIYSTLPCFNIQCDDIGEHKSSESGAVCGDRSPLTPLAGYRPESDVLDYARFDLDILWLDALMAMGAYEAAEDLYLFGKHAEADDFRSALSLSTLATDDSRTMVPEFTSFSQYFGSDDYADDIIRATFDPASNMSPIHRRHTAVGASQYMVMYMATLQAMYESIANCGRQDLSAVFWDQAAAYIVGFLEGPVSGGSDEGLMIWGLAKEHCNEFGTCSAITPGAAQANDRILNLLYAGQGALTAGSCDVLRKTTNELSIELRIPLLQGALSLTAKTASDRSGKAAGRDERAKDHAKAYVLARSILPLIANKNRDESNLIEKNLDFEGSVLQEDGAGAVSLAFARSVTALEVPCEAVGVSKTIDVCSGVVKESSKNTGLIVSLVLVFTFMFIGIGLLILHRRRKRKGGKSVSDDSMNGTNGNGGPVFVRNDAGEMNHESTENGGIGPDAQNGDEHDASPMDDDDLNGSPELPAPV